jgi:nucleoside-diphosphate-sugar epimerase
MRVLITGAHGFIGGAIARRLEEDPSMEIFAASRAPRAPQGRVLPVQLDLLDPGSLDRAPPGADAVIHCAYGDRASTVEGTRNLLAWARKAGVPRLVHLSSIAVYGPATGEVAENHPRVPSTGGDYAAWKSEAEALCEAATQIGTVLLRPSIVHGAGSALWVTKMARRLQVGAIGDLGPAGEGLCNLVHVRDVAEAAVAGLTGRPGAYNVNGTGINSTGAITWNEYFARLARAAGLPLPRLSSASLRLRDLAAFPVKALGKLLPPLRGALPARLLETPLPAERKLYALRATYPVAKAAEGLGWSPRIGLDEGIADGASWWRQAQ